MDLLLRIAGFDVNLIELGAVVAGFGYVILNIRQNIWTWPVGLVSVSLFLVLFFQARLYADAFLQVVYIILSVYGWYYWLHGGRDHGEARVTRLRPGLAGLLGAIVVVGTALSGYLLATYTDADLPYWDSFTTVTSLVGQWMSAKKILENWLVWIGVDAVYVGIYLYKDLPLTTLLFASYLVLAAIGFRAWKSSMQTSMETAPAPSSASS